MSFPWYVLIMENSQIFEVPLDSPIDYDSADMLSPANSPTLALNRQQYQGSVLPNSLRYEHDGYFAGEHAHEFNHVAGGNIKDDKGSEYTVKKHQAYYAPVYNITSGNVSFDYYPLTAVIQSNTDAIVTNKAGDLFDVTLNDKTITVNKDTADVSGSNIDVKIHEFDPQLFTFDLAIVDKDKSVDKHIAITKGEGVSIGYDTYLYTYEKGVHKWGDQFSYDDSFYYADGNINNINITDNSISFTYSLLLETTETLQLVTEISSYNFKYSYTTTETGLDPLYYSQSTIGNTVTINLPTWFNISILSPDTPAYDAASSFKLDPVTFNSNPDIMFTATCNNKLYIRITGKGNYTVGSYINMIKNTILRAFRDSGSYDSYTGYINGVENAFEIESYTRYAVNKDIQYAEPLLQIEAIHNTGSTEEFGVIYSITHDSPFFSVNVKPKKVQFIISESNDVNDAKYIIEAPLPVPKYITDYTNDDYRNWHYLYDAWQNSNTDNNIRLLERLGTAFISGSVHYLRDITGDDIDIVKAPQGATLNATAKNNIAEAINEYISFDEYTQCVQQRIRRAVGESEPELTYTTFIRSPYFAFDLVDSDTSIRNQQLCIPWTSMFYGTDLCLLKANNDIIAKNSNMLASIISQAVNGRGITNDDPFVNSKFYCNNSLSLDESSQYFNNIVYMDEDSDGRYNVSGSMSKGGEGSGISPEVGYLSTKNVYANGNKYYYICHSVNYSTSSDSQSVNKRSYICIDHDIKYKKYVSSNLPEYVECKLVLLTNRLDIIATASETNPKVAYYQYDPTFNKFAITGSICDKSGSTPTISFTRPQSIRLSYLYALSPFMKEVIKDVYLEKLKNTNILEYAFCRMGYMIELTNTSFKLIDDISISVNRFDDVNRWIPYVTSGGSYLEEMSTYKEGMPIKRVFFKDSTRQAYFAMLFNSSITFNTELNSTTGASAVNVISNPNNMSVYVKSNKIDIENKEATTVVALSGLTYRFKNNEGEAGYGKTYPDDASQVPLYISSGTIDNAMMSNNYYDAIYIDSDECLYVDVVSTIDPTYVITAATVTPESEWQHGLNKDMASNEVTFTDNTVAVTCKDAAMSYSLQFNQKTQEVTFDGAISFVVNDIGNYTITKRKNYDQSVTLKMVSSTDNVLQINSVIDNKYNVEYNGTSLMFDTELNMYSVDSPFSNYSIDNVSFAEDISFHLEGSELYTATVTVKDIYNLNGITRENINDREITFNR